jgi:alkane 1-monooxygenase
LNSLHTQLYRYSFWLAPMVALPFWFGVMRALDDATNAWWTWWAVIVIQGIVPLLDAPLGRVVTRFSKDEQAALVRDRMLRAVPWVCGFVWLATLAWAISVTPQIMQLPAIHVVGFVVSLGIVGGIMAINVGHELIHRNNKAERFLGGVLLASVCYGVFKVEHVRGHHLRVGTMDDPATARLNETAYAFVPRAIIGTFTHAWRLEADRLARGSHTGFARWLRNEALHWIVLSVVFAGAAVWVSGWAALGVFILGGLVAIIELELVDYIEHYGLSRPRDASGALTPVRYEHSWDYSGWFTNAMLINLQRHSDHHAHGGRAFGALNSHLEAPQLPANYATMIKLALIPPLYRRVIHPRLALIR